MISSTKATERLRKNINYRFELAQAMFRPQSISDAAVGSKTPKEICANFKSRNINDFNSVARSSGYNIPAQQQERTLLKEV